MDNIPHKLTALSLLAAISLNSMSVQAFSIYKKRQDKVIASGVSDYRLTFVNIDWWDNFSDPYLKEYIFKSIKHNHDLRIATLRTREYYENMRAVRANELPQAQIAANYIRIRTPGFDFDGIDLLDSSTNLFSVPLIASYEADIFLKNHDKTKSAKKEYQASRYEEKAAYISLAANCATTYFNIVKLDRLIELQEEVVKVRKEIFDLTKDRNKAGLASTFDTTATDKQHTIAMIELAELKKQRANQLHQLAVLMGEPPSCADSIERSKIEDIEYLKPIPKCISSDVVVNRPDMMKVEMLLQKAKIDVRVARKEFLPTIPIFGVVGFATTESKRLFDWDSFLALIGVGISQKVFTGGKLIANLHLQKVKYEELYETYKQTDLTAMQEINDSLCNIKYDTEKDNDNIRKYKLEKDNYGLIDLRYQAGITSRYDLIQFYENLLVLQKDITNSKTQRLVDYLTLYKSVGGML